LQAVVTSRGRGKIERPGKITFMRRNRGGNELRDYEVSWPDGMTPAQVDAWNTACDSSAAAAPAKSGGYFSETT
jgi:hypothetical protein